MAKISTRIIFLSPFKNWSFNVLHLLTNIWIKLIFFCDFCSFWRQFRKLEIYSPLGTTNKISYYPDLLLSYLWTKFVHWIIGGIFIKIEWLYNTAFCIYHPIFWNFEIKRADQGLALYHSEVFGRTHRNKTHELYVVRLNID